MGHQFSLKKFGVIFTLAAALSLGAFLLIPPPLVKPETGKPFFTSFMLDSRNSGKGGATWAPLQDISPSFICAVIKAEDRSFFRHSGFDFPAIYRAIVKILMGGSRIGASTITQQLAKNFYGSRHRSWQGKFKEAFFAVRLEFFLSKAEILEYYLNSIEFGDGLWGVADASHYYFNKSAGSLGLGESLILTSLIANPLDSAGEAQQIRMKTLMHRVNYQFQASGLYELLDQSAVDKLMSEVEQTLASGLRNPPIVFASNVALRQTMTEAIAQECGLERELKLE